MLARRGEGALAHCRFMIQNVKQFRSEEDLTMQHAISENLEQFEEELVARMLEEVGPERRLRGLARRSACGG